MKKILSALLLFVAVAFQSCNSESDHAAADLVITASDQSLSIDDRQEITFKVMFKGAEVTDSVTIINVTDGGYEIIKDQKFTTLRPYTYKFIATYGTYTTVQPLEVTAFTGDMVSGEYYRRNIIYKYTGTWCTFCPNMSTVIKNLQKETPDRYIEISIHQNDQISYDWAQIYLKDFGVENLPTVVVDANSDYFVDKPLAPQVEQYLKKSKEENPTVAGLKMATKVENGKMIVDVEANVLESNDYSLSVFYLVSGYSYDQSGVAAGQEYFQNHVLTGYFQDNSRGEELEDLVMNETVQRSYSLDMPEGITSDRIEIVAYIKNHQGKGIYHINNAISCAVGDTVDYQFEAK